MNITLEPSRQQGIIARIAYHDGMAIGRIDEHLGNSASTRFHAVLDLSVTAKGPASLLIAQGFGETAELAIQDAFKNERERNANYLAALEAMHALLNGAEVQP